MKTILHKGLALAALLLPVFLHAQEGILAISYAPQNTWIMNARDINPDRRDFTYVPTFNHSVQMEVGWHFIPPFGIHTGISYSRQGQVSTSTDEVTGETITTTRDLEYVKVPVLLHFTTDPAPVVAYLSFGPSFNILRSAVHTESPAQETVTPTDFTTADLYKKVDVAVAWRLGTDIGLGKKVALMLFHHGDVSVGDMENKGLISNGSRVFERTRGLTQNLTLGLGVGLKFVIMEGRGYYCVPGSHHARR